MKKIFFISLTLCLISHISFSQQVPEKAMAYYFKAKDFGARTQYEEAIEELQYAVKVYPKYTQAKELLGEYFFILKKYDDAIAVLESTANEKDFTARSTYMLSEIYLKNNNAEKAKFYAERYLAMPSKVPNATAKAELTVRNVEFATHAKKNPVPFNPINLGVNINTSNQEYFPYLTPDGKILTFTRMQNNQEDLYIAQKIDSGFAKAVSFGTNINTYENEGAETMNAEGTILFFTSCNKFDGYGSCDIYYS